MSLLAQRPPPVPLPLAAPEVLHWSLSHCLICTATASPSAAPCNATSCVSRSIALTQAIQLSLALLMIAVYSLHQTLTKAASAPSSPHRAGEQSGSAAAKLEGHRSAEGLWRSRNVRRRTFCIHHTASSFTASVNSVYHVKSFFNNPLGKLKWYLSLAMKLQITEEKVKRKKSASIYIL